MKKLYSLFILSLLAMGLTHAQAPLFFSEYMEGSSYNKSLEVYNPSDAEVNLDDYRIVSGSAGGEWQYYNTFTSGASIAAKGVYVLVESRISADVFDVADADQSGAYPCNFNGDDARAIAFITLTDTTYLDVIGLVDGVDPGSGWDVADVGSATANHTLVRKPNITNGTTDWAASAGTDATNSQWMVWDQDDASNLGIAPATVSSISIAGEGDVSNIDVDDATLQIVATIDPTDASVPSPTWSVDNDALASIDENGLLTAMENGDVEITASVSDGISTVTGTMIVTLSNQISIVPVATITVTGTGDATTITENIGSLQMLAAIDPSNADDPTVSWSVDDEYIATITDDGMLSAVRNGTVTVTATANDGYGATGALDVTISEQAEEMLPLFFSEYIEGGSSNKALEIYNPNDVDVNLALYQIAQATNGEGWKYYDAFASGASIAVGDVYVVANGGSVTAILDVADETMTYPVYFNGNDARALIYITATDTTIIDVIGLESPDPGTAWEVAGVSNATQNHTLVRKSNVQAGNADWASSAGTNTEDSEWIVYDQDEFSYLGAHTCIPLITSITLAGEGGATSIDTDKGTLQIEATILPVEAAGQDLEWTVNDENMASVSETGLLQAINDGTVTVTATANDGSGTFETIDIVITEQVTIIPVIAIAVTGTGDATTITDNGGTLQMLAEVTPGDATDDTYTWSVDDETVATISVDGLLTAVNNGDVTVIATANDGYGANGELVVTVSGQYTEVADLTALKAMDPSDETSVYMIAGEVVLTNLQSFRNKKHVQDAAAGVLIDDDPGVITTVYNVGDGITGLMGTIEEYAGMFQLHPVADPGAASSTGNTVTPIAVTLAQLNENQDMYESMVVSVESVNFIEADGSATFENGESYNIRNATDTLVCRSEFYSTDLIGTVIPDSANVTGISQEYYGTAQLAPRGLADVVELVPYAPSDDASITDLLVGGTSVEGFSPALLSYNVELPDTTVTVPTVTVVTTNDNAVVVVTDATDLAGTEAERTTTVVITSEDESATKTYTVTFSLVVGIGNQFGESVEIYPVPAIDFLHVRGVESITELRMISITGSTMRVLDLNGEKNIQLNISELESGVYFLKLSGEETTQILRFIKN